MGLGFLLVLQMNEKELEESEQQADNQEEGVSQVEEVSKTLSIADTMLNDTLIVKIKDAEPLSFHNADSLAGEDLSNWRSSIIDSLTTEYSTSSVTEMTSSNDVTPMSEEVITEESLATIENDVLRLTVSSKGWTDS